MTFSKNLESGGKQMEYAIETFVLLFRKLYFITQIVKYLRRTLL
jgi:hypothetical protein